MSTNTFSFEDEAQTIILRDEDKKHIATVDREKNAVSFEHFSYRKNYGDVIYAMADLDKPVESAEPAPEPTPEPSPSEEQAEPAPHPVCGRFSHEHLTHDLENKSAKQLAAKWTSPPITNKMRRNLTPEQLIIIEKLDKTENR